METLLSDKSCAKLFIEVCVSACIITREQNYNAHFLI